MTDREQALLSLARESKPAVYAEKLVTHYRADFERALAYELVSGHLAFEPFLAAVKHDVAKNSLLAEAVQTSPGSFIAALQHAAQCKLLPGAAHGLFYLIPRRNKGVLEVNPMVGYKGLCTMSARHKRVHSVEAFLVYKGEKFEFDAGAGKLTHIVDLMADHSEDNIVGGYMRAIITEEATQHAVVDHPIIYVMTRADILKRRNSSDAWKRAESSGKKDSPWHLWPDMMWRKTVLIGGLNHGSVPRDLGVGGLLSAEAEADKGEETLPLPKPTQAGNIRTTLGLDEKQEKFDLVEQAVQAIGDAMSDERLRFIAAGWQHFKGTDAQTIANAYQDRLDQIRDEAGNQSKEE